MSRRKLLPVTVVPVVALLLGALMAAPGRAGEPDGSICAQGSLTGGLPTSDNPPLTPLSVSIQPCAGTDPAVVGQARWGVAHYRDLRGSIGFFYPFRPDGPATGELSYHHGTLAATAYGPIRAACLITGLNSRVACVRITVDEPTGTVGFSPLPANDPLVDRPVTPVGADNEADPVCGACV